MGRLVRKPQIPDLDAQIAGLEGVLQSGIGGIGGMQMAGAIPGDNYLERMAKYVPAEIIAFSMVVNSILEQAMKAGGKNAVMAGFPVTSIAAGALVLAAVLLVRPRGGRRLDRQRLRIDARLSVLGLSHGRRRFRRSSRRQPGGDPRADFHRGQRPHFAAGAPAQAAAQAGGAGGSHGKPASGRGARRLDARTARARPRPRIVAASPKNIRH